MAHPFRLACTGTNAAPYKGCCYDHNPQPVNVVEYSNTTVITDATGTNVPPYERYFSNPSPPGCETDFCSGGTIPCTSWPYPYPSNTFTSSGTINFAVGHKKGFKNVQARRLWQGAFGWTSGDAACADTVCNGTQTWESYQSTPDQTKYLTCTYDVHVRNSFAVGEDAGGSLSADKTGSRSVNATTGEITSSLITTETSVENFDGTICTNFYTNGGAGYTNGDCSGEVAFPKGLTTTIDGVDTDLHCGFPLMRPDDPTFLLPDLISMWNGQTYAGGDGPGGTNPFVPGSAMPLITDLNNYSYSGSGTINDGETTYGVVVSFSRTATTVSWNFLLTDNFDGGPPGSNSFNYYGSITLSDANTASAIYDDVVDNLLSLWPLNDDKLYPWRTDTKVGLAPLVSRNETGPQNPIGFNTYTVDDLTDPIDDSSGNAPFSPGWTPTYGQRAWFDPSCYIWTFSPGMDSSDSAATGLQLLFDGSILGGPEPAGYHDYFDFGYNDWTGCCYEPGDGSVGWDWYRKGYGMFVSAFNSSAGCQLPLNSTQWPNYFQSVNKPQGAYLFYNDTASYYPPSCISSSGSPSQALDANALWACKYAEILDLWPSQNFARPGGMDKFSFDETQVYCAANLSGSGPGSTWTITNYDTTTPPDGTDFSGYWGGPVVGGFFNVTSYSGGVLTLGSQVYNVPSSWTSAAAGDDTATCFGKLRFPSTPSLLGRAPITMAGMTATFNPAQPTFGMAVAGTETVDVYDFGMTLLASGVTATRVDDSHFTLPSSYPTARWLMINGAPAYYFSDSNPKGDYVLLEWVSDFRSSGEFNRLNGTTDCTGTQVTQPSTNAGGGPVANQYGYFSQTDACLPFIPCVPKVVCISPNGETWTNGTTYPFPSMLPGGSAPSSAPSDFFFDQTYGSKWWGYVQVTMTDLFWDGAHKPCGFVDSGDTLQWAMDDGTCEADFDEETDSGTVHHKFYAYAPQVEARVTLPCNYDTGSTCAPSLPAGISIGWLSPVNYSSGDVAYPPIPPAFSATDGSTGSANTAYSLHSLFCADMGSCRFNYVYPGC